MALAEQQNALSWSQNTSPLVFSDIFFPTTSVTIWNREPDAEIQAYYESVFSALLMAVRSVFSMQGLKRELADTLPAGEGKDKAVEDIYLLSDMLTCLFDCDSVGLRLVPMKSAMCPKFHVDNIPVRLVTTYLGSGTEWMPTEAIKQRPQRDKGTILTKVSKGYDCDPNHIQRMSAFDVALLKGKAWEQQEPMAAVHRSCQLGENEKRVLLTLDPL